MNILVVFLLALVISSVGFMMYVYFFSVGYGFSIAGISALLMFLFRGNLTPATILMCILLLIYGARLGLYLLIRENKSVNYKKLLKSESKSNVPVFVKCCIWVSCALLYLCQMSPVLFRLQNGARDDTAAYIGMVLMAAGIVIEMIADMEKAKAKKTNPSSFVSSGLYRMVRCPNYFGELLLWTGAFVSGITIFSSPLQWALGIIGFAGIVYVMLSGARRLEIRQDKNYGKLDEYQKYVQKTPIIIPLIPLYSVKKHKWLVA